MAKEARFRAPEGTKDVLPAQVPLWLRMEEAARNVCARYGYEELRPPVLEYTRLFHKSTGETTDIVEKEMYTFGSEEDSISLRPEITPSVVRALIEHSLHRQKGFWKFFTIGPVFRHERPQKGRQRQFHQLNVEAVGSMSPLVDVELMLVYRDFLAEAGVTEYELKINSMGCPKCRPGYRDALKDAIRPNLEEHCANCRKRFERNVFRILDCKVEGCVRLTKELPAVLDSACEECRAHFAGVERGLEDAGLAYRVDPRIVRGLDYYTRTVFEFASPALGAQDALCGGGRYDLLVGGMGGPDIGANGFASGLERVLLAMEACGVRADPAARDFYVVAVGDDVRADAFRLAGELRGAGLKGDLDFEGRSLKAQMRSANKAGVRCALIVGKDELDAGVVRVKVMESGEERMVPRVEIVHFLKGEQR
ncbi:MAG: histidine--tRNA ligase [Planctomycetota bacterium]|jgi:histidyl-tRNA synthetase